MNFEVEIGTREKIWSDFIAKWNEEWSEKSAVFCREREIEVWKKFCKRAKFSVHLRHFQAVSFIFLVKRFCYELVLVVVWRLMEINLNFMLICRFFIYLADFWANCCNFWRLFSFNASNGYWKDQFIIEQILVNNWLQFRGYAALFVEKYDRKWRRLKLLLSNFLHFFGFLFFRQIS